jgi:DNA-binding winged helix-turn-helix (wHTH) protein
VAWRAINYDGIRVGYRTYDNPDLGPYRRQPSPASARQGLWEVHHDGREVYRDGRYVALTRKQSAVLEVLVAAEGGAVSAEELLAQAWDENTDPFTNAARITISALRERLGEPWVIATVAGAEHCISTQAGQDDQGDQAGSHHGGRLGPPPVQRRPQHGQEGELERPRAGEPALGLDQQTDEDAGGEKDLSAAPGSLNVKP